MLRPRRWGPPSLVGCVGPQPRRGPSIACRVGGTSRQAGEGQGHSAGPLCVRGHPRESPGVARFHFCCHDGGHWQGSSEVSRPCCPRLRAHL
eukprot:3695255-Alexandrium_andersonii.AAC.1